MSNKNILDGHKRLELTIAGNTYFLNVEDFAVKESSDVIADYIGVDNVTSLLNLLSRTESGYSELEIIAAYVKESNGHPYLTEIADRILNIFGHDLEKVTLEELILKPKFQTYKKPK